MTEKKKRTLKDGVKNLIGKYKALEHGIIEVLENNIFSFIDSIQEEPVSTKDKLLALSDGRLHLGWIDDAKVVEFEECLMQFHEDMNNIPQGTDGLTRLKDTDGVLHSYSKKLMSMAKEEPVSEDLEKEYDKYIENDGDESLSKEYFLKLCQHFANWQKEQFEKNRLAACDRQTEKEAEREQDFVMGIIENEHRKPTFDDAIKYGMRLQRKNMMKDAVDAVVHIEAGNYPYIPQLELYDYDKDIPLAKEGDKYKVVLIKEG